MSTDDWTIDALCRQVGGDDFFPEKGGTPEPAKKICRRCDVQAECLEYALSTDQRWGVWGGYSERERRKLKRQVAA